MGYNLPEDLEEFRKVVRSFAEEKIKPIAFHLDQSKEFPKEIVKEMGEMGLMGIPSQKNMVEQDLLTNITL